MFYIKILWRLSVWEAKRGWFNFASKLISRDSGDTCRRNIARSFIIMLIEVSLVTRKTFRVKKTRRRREENERKERAERCAFIGAGLHNWTDISTLFISSLRNDGRGLRRSRGREAWHRGRDEGQHYQNIRERQCYLKTRWRRGRMRK